MIKINTRKIMKKPIMSVLYLLLTLTTISNVHASSGGSSQRGFQMYEFTQRMYDCQGQNEVSSDHGNNRDSTLTTTDHRYTSGGTGAATAWRADCFATPITNSLTPQTRLVDSDSCDSVLFASGNCLFRAPTGLSVGSKVRVPNLAAGFTGSIDLTCQTPSSISTTLAQRAAQWTGATALCDNVLEASCASETVMWTGGSGRSCSATLGLAADGTNLTVRPREKAHIGSISVSCNSGVWSALVSTDCQLSCRSPSVTYKPVINYGACKERLTDLSGRITGYSGGEQSVQGYFANGSKMGNTGIRDYLSYHALQADVVCEAGVWKVDKATSTCSEVTSAITATSYTSETMGGENIICAEKDINAPTVPSGFETVDVLYECHITNDD
jgi:hypothetical protein